MSDSADPMRRPRRRGRGTAGRLGGGGDGLIAAGGPRQGHSPTHRAWRDGGLTQAGLSRAPDFSGCAPHTFESCPNACGAFWRAACSTWLVARFRRFQASGRLRGEAVARDRTGRPPRVISGVLARQCTTAAPGSREQHGRPTDSEHTGPAFTTRPGAAKAGACSVRATIPLEFRGVIARSRNGSPAQPRTIC